MKNYAKIELHCHLDGSLYLPWAYEIALKEKVIPSNYSFEEYYNEFYLLEKVKTSEEAIKCFDFPLLVLQTKDNITQAVYELSGRLAEQGLIYAEIRFGSQLHTRGGLTQNEVMEAACKGVEMANRDYSTIHVGLINCLMHAMPDANANMKENLEAIEVTKKYLGKGCVGLDLAGYENTGDFMLYKPLFDKAREYNIPYTIHAGEMGEGKHVIDAINMGAYRIGHGINCIQNDEWLNKVVETQIPLEVCVSSNCGVARNYAEHPIRKLIEAGAKVTINCDNMSYSRTSLLNEHRQLKTIGITDEILHKCAMNAIDAAFCSNELKENLYKQLEEDNK